MLGARLVGELVDASKTTLDARPVLRPVTGFSAIVENTPIFATVLMRGSRRTGRRASSDRDPRRSARVAASWRKVSMRSPSTAPPAHGRRSRRTSGLAVRRRAARVCRCGAPCRTRSARAGGGRGKGEERRAMTVYIRTLESGPVEGAKRKKSDKSAARKPVLTASDCCFDECVGSSRPERRPRDP